MDRPNIVPPPLRTVEDLADAQDLRSVILAALTAKPVDEHALRRGVWTFVGAERVAGASPGQVILALSDLVGSTKLSSSSESARRTRQVILWSVEAYFGRLGGDGVGCTEDTPLDSSSTETV